VKRRHARDSRALRASGEIRFSEIDPVHFVEFDCSQQLRSVDADHRIEHDERSNRFGYLIARRFVERFEDEHRFGDNEIGKQ
jgi:hypothetical protein